MNELMLDEVYDVWYTSFWHTWPGILIIGGLALCGILVVYVVAKAIQSYRLGTSKDAALRNLQALAARVEKGSIELRNVYQELTDIVKRYSQWRYMMPRGMTDYELVTWLKDTECSENQRVLIERIVAEAQAVKFGHLIAPKKQVLTDIATAASFVEVGGERTS